MPFYFIIITVFIIAIVIITYVMNKKEIKKNGVKLSKIWLHIFVSILFIIIITIFFCAVDVSDNGNTYDYKRPMSSPMSLIEGISNNTLSITNGKIKISFINEDGKLKKKTVRLSFTSRNNYYVGNGDVSKPTIKIHWIKNSKTFFTPGIMPMKQYEIILPMDYKIELKNR